MINGVSLNRTFRKYAYIVATGKITNKPMSLKAIFLEQVMKKSR